VLAAKRASNGAEGKDMGARIKMIERFLLDRISGDRGACSINEAVKPAVLVLPYSADPLFPRGYGAMMGAEDTLDHVMFSGVPKPCLVLHSHDSKATVFLNVLTK
jgi:hypothetical protein